MSMLESPQKYQKLHRNQKVIDLRWLGLVGKERQMKNHVRGDNIEGLREIRNSQGPERVKSQNIETRLCTKCVKGERMVVVINRQALLKYPWFKGIYLFAENQINTINLLSISFSPFLALSMVEYDILSAQVIQIFVAVVTSFSSCIFLSTFLLFFSSSLATHFH